MKLAELAKVLEAEIVVEGNPEKEITGGHAGDFLSFVMSRAPEGCVWFTVMSNVNVAAVAYMADVGAIVLCDGIKPEPPLTERCVKENINLLTTELDTYGAACRLALYENQL